MGAVQEWFQYAVTMLIVEDGKAYGSAGAAWSERRKIDCREWLTVLTVAGEVFDIAKQDVSHERLARLRDMARAVLDEETAETNA